MNYQLISAIIKNKWAIDTQFALQYGGMLRDILAGNVEVEQEASKNYLPVALSIDAKTNAVTYYDFKSAPVGSIAVIKLMGPMMKNDQSCGPIGMATIGKRIQEADNNSNFSAIMLHIDSPGGTVDGTENLANIVKGVQKPIITFADGLMASAVIWIGSSSDEVWASNAHDEIGSVGVLSSFMDVQPAYELQGVKFHTIVADQSKDKTKMFEDLRKGIYDEYKTEFLNPLAQLFINSMKANRPAAEEKHLTGKVFFAKDVMGVFVDKIGTFEEAVARAAELGKQKMDLNNKNKPMLKKQFVHVNKVLKVDSIESSDDKGVYFNEDQLAALDAELQAKSESDSARVTAETSVADVNNQLDTIDATVKEAKTTAEKVAAIKTKLAGKPGVQPENGKGADPKESADGVNWDKMNSLPHNQEADQNL